MKHLLSVIILFSGLHSYAQKANHYPTAPKDSIYDTYFDQKIPDPYQWMENPEDRRLEWWLEDQEKIITRETKRQTHIWELRSQISSMYRNTRRKKTDDYVKRDENLDDKYDFDRKWKGPRNYLELLYKLKDEKNYRR